MERAWPVYLLLMVGHGNMFPIQLIMNYRGNLLTAKREFAYNYFVDSANLEERLNNLNSHYFNFYIAQCYESFESFLKEILIEYFMSNPNDKNLTSGEIITFTCEDCKAGIQKLEVVKINTTKGC